LPTNLAEQYVRAAVEALQAPEGTIPVKISALKALNKQDDNIMYFRSID
jgi:hypothetical protein